ncbi:hypothetical protein [Streptomyces sp. H27-C3]|uniref:hypothetical protein n=1 Tax=Streptomyces sp. H27-C3 TaxID=3046305 RepID=UPI0024B9E691|nr:hypothetical protein [Streptomyces sp. H27-C3]MDJ0463980.1 hypothetical protein [Streptomyces sp. H27-C3]
MSTAEISEHPPIYDRLIQERGDVPAETREAAEQAKHRMQQALDWSSVHPAMRESGDGRTFSAFG